MMNRDCLGLLFQFNSELKTSFAVTCKWFYALSRNSLTSSFDEAVEVRDVLSIVNIPNWWTFISNCDLGNIGSVFLLRAYVRKGVMFNLSEVMTQACMYNNLELVRHLVSEYQDLLNIIGTWNYWLERVCFKGYKEIVHVLIENGANNWDGGFIEACFGGHPEIAKLMLEHGATQTDSGFYHLCEQENVLAARCMLECGVNVSAYGLRNACYRGNMDIIKLMIEYKSDDFNEGLSIACQMGHKDVVNFMITCGATECHCGRPLENH